MSKSERERKRERESERESYTRRDSRKNKHHKVKKLQHNVPQKSTTNPFGKLHLHLQATGNLI